MDCIFIMGISGQIIASYNYKNKKTCKKQGYFFRFLPLIDERDIFLFNNLKLINYEN